MIRSREAEGTGALRVNLSTFFLTLGVLALAGVSAVDADAQSPSSVGTISINANIVQSATVRGVNNLNFGDIIALTSTTTKDIAKSDPNAGLFEVTGATGQAVQVTFAAPSTLTRSGGAGTLPIALTVYGASTQAGAGGAQQVLSRGTVTLANGRYFLFVAGRLTVRDLGVNPAGTYTGQFELSITHTTI